MSCNSCPVKRKKKSSCPKKKSKKSRCPACGRSVCRCCPTPRRRRTKTNNTRGARFGSTGRMPSAPIPFYYPQVPSAPQSQFMRVGQPTDGFVANMPVSANNKIAARRFFSQGIQVGVRIPPENLTAGEATNTLPIQQGTHEPIHVEPRRRDKKYYEQLIRKKADEYKARALATQASANSDPAPEPFTGQALDPQDWQQYENYEREGHQATDNRIPAMGDNFNTPDDPPPRMATAIPTNNNRISAGGNFSATHQASALHQDYTALVM